MPRRSPSAAPSDPLLPDFAAERARHAGFTGRAAVLAAMNDFLQHIDNRGGWLLLRGGPGLGKSALLSHWLGPLDAPRWPHHFIRRGVNSWDQPRFIAASLVAQLEQRFPEQRDRNLRDLDPQVWIPELLRRIAVRELMPRNGSLVLVLDGLDEVQGDPAADAQNSLPRFLPSRVYVLCSARSGYPHADPILLRDHARCIDLDAPEWADSNQVVAPARAAPPAGAAPAPGSPDPDPDPAAPAARVRVRLLHPLQRGSSEPCVATLVGPYELPCAAEFSPDGSRLVLTNDRFFRVFALDPFGTDTGAGSLSGSSPLRELPAIPGQPGGTSTLLFSPDGSLAYSASFDHTLKIWDAETFDCLHTFQGKKSFSALTATPFGLVAGDNRGDLWFLQLTRDSSC